MTKRILMTSAVALVAGIGLASGPASADPHADGVINFAPVTSGTDESGGTIDTSEDWHIDDADEDGVPAEDGTGALGAPDAGNSHFFVSLGFDANSTSDPADDSGGVLEVSFDNNACLDLAGDDLSVPDVGNNESADVDVSASGGAPYTFAESVGPGDFDVDAGSHFNAVRLTATDFAGSTNVAGFDVDALTCNYSLDVADIAKDFAENPGDGADDKNLGDGNPDLILTGLDDLQHKAFTIEITNNTGEDDAFAGLTFFDVVPAEWDADPTGEGDDPDGDGGGDGIAVVSGNCTASIIEHQSNGKSGKPQLKPEFITIDASDLDDGDSCVIKVWVQTDQDHPGKGKGNPDATPSSCPVTLNDGVRVMDSSGNILLQDDDSLVYVEDPDELNPNEGTCAAG